MDETRRKVLLQELDEATKERERLSAYIEILAERLGIEVAKDGSDSGVREAPVGNLRLPPVDSVNESQFYGHSATRAAQAVLDMFGAERPLKTQELYDAITKGGVRIKDADTLYRSLRRDPRFHRVGRGLWGLSEWYPSAAPRRQVDDAEADLEAAGVDEAGDEETSTPL